MPNLLEELKRACKAESKLSTSERIKEGESHWFAGMPARAEDGFVAIAQENDIITVIPERDVLEVKKEERLFLVRVRGNADVLVRFERVAKVQAGGDCGCEADKDEDENTKVVSARRSQLFGDPFGPFGTPIGPCRLYIRCYYYQGMQLCWWVIHCPGGVGRI